ncbi:MAG TPA: condensation domain-containing protein, partial [Thermoanaerobaculia bacterium]|nr:condensation domain-containing protein [Thermoanaerobaculia bacterium]
MLANGLEPVPMGVVGELHLSGAGLARGYLHRPDLTAERFIPDLFAAEPGARLYRTGDLARWTVGGELEFLGRLDHQVKVRGFRIELGEVEAALARHPAVAQSVAGVRGEGGDRRLIAYLLLRPGEATPGVGELRAFLQESLPGYMVPSVFVPLSAFPLTPNGKVDRKALPDPERQASEDRYLPPRTPLEEVLAGIWAGLLRIDRVGAADNFFELGGHSLLATQVVSRLRGAFGVEIPLRDLFEAPRLADLAGRVEAARRAGTSWTAPPLIPIAPALRQGPLPLSFAQQRLWFVDRFEPGSPLYNVQVALHVEGPLGSAVLMRCLGEVVRRHETLRTVFAAPEGSAVQVIQPAAPFVLPMVDLSGLPWAIREATALSLTAKEAGRPFDLTRGPLLRGLLIQMTQSGASSRQDMDHVAVLTLHHIVSDGWSMGILVREVTALYAAFAEGRPSPLPELPVQYADFATWQRSWLQGEFLESEVSYWRGQLAGLPSLLELPTDRPRPAVQSFRGTIRSVSLPGELTRQARFLSRREGATLFMVLLAGFQALLARYSGQQELAVGSPVAGRNRTETEGLIGFFVNTLVLRGDLTSDPSIEELVGRVRETALAAYLHQDVPFEKLVQELSPERNRAQTPLFQVMLALQNLPVESLEMPDLRLRPVSLEATTATCDMALRVWEHDGGLSGGIEYATDLFDAATIDRLMGSFERLLTAALATPDVSTFALPLLSEGESAQLLGEWNDTRIGGLSEGCLHRDVAAQAARTPSAVAIELGAERWTYRRLMGSARLLARHLRELGVGPDVIVGLCAERSPAMVVAMLAVLEAGGVYLPLDPAYPAERLSFMLDDSGALILLIQEPLLERVPTDYRLMVLLDERWDSGDEEVGEPLEAEVTPDHLAYVMYTSGSTGQP